jgi:hypothetical protein
VGIFFCDILHLTTSNKKFSQMTPSDKKLGSGAKEIIVYFRGAKRGRKGQKGIF